MVDYRQGNKVERRRPRPRHVVNLTDFVRRHAARLEVTLETLTVFGAGIDPFRLDTDANHMIGAWLRDGMDQLSILDNNVTYHNRGLHYAFLAKVRMPSAGTHPNGHPRMSGQLFALASKRYDGSARAYEFLEKATAAARWLGYIPFDKIKDERNEKPAIVQQGEEVEFESGVALQCDIKNLKNAARGWTEDDPVPALTTFDWDAYAINAEVKQKFRIALWTEKSSARDRLKSFARDLDLDLYAPTGETSATMAYQMARTASEDGRPLIVLVFADCDPSGYQMLVSLAHKLRAFREQQFPDLEFEVVEAGLTVAQVKEFEEQGLHLPPNRLKDAEKRAGAWRQAHGIEQIELDAICTLHPERFDEIIGKAINPWFDHDLEDNAAEAVEQYQKSLKRRFRNAAKKQGKLAKINDAHGRVSKALGELTDAVADLRNNVDSVEFDIPDLVLPESETEHSLGDGYVGTTVSFSKHVRLMKARKQYDE